MGNQLATLSKAERAIALATEPEEVKAIEARLKMMSEAVAAQAAGGGAPGRLVNVA